MLRLARGVILVMQASQYRRRDDSMPLGQCGGRFDGRRPRPF